MKKLFIFCSMLCFTPVLHAQRVGIGTTAPQNKLTVRDTTSPFVMRLMGTSYETSMFLGDGNANTLKIGNVNGTAIIDNQLGGDVLIGTGVPNAGLYLSYPAGNVGIGTISPFARLEVSDDTNTELGLFQGWGGFGRVRVNNNGTSTALGAQAGLGYVGTAWENDFAIRTNDINRMYFDHETGHIGIGTNAPLHLFHVFNANPFSTIASFTSSGGFGQIEVGNSTVVTDLGADETKGYTGTNSNHNFGIRAGGDTHILVEENSGNVGIGTMDPQTKLDVSGNVRFDGGLSMTGSVGIGVDAPNESKLHVRYDGSNGPVVRFDGNSAYDKYFEFIKGSRVFYGGLFSDIARMEAGGVNEFRFGINGNSAIRLLPSGNLYIGSATNFTPLSRLVVDGNGVANTPVAQFSNNSSQSSIRIANTSSHIFLGAVDSFAYAGTQDNHDFRIMTNGMTKMTFDAQSGFTGIGTEPTTFFNVHSGMPYSDIALFESLFGQGQILVTAGMASACLGAEEARAYVGTANGYDFAIRTGGNTRMIIQDFNGHVGIGTTSAEKRLTIQADINEDVMQFKTYSGAPKWHWWMPGGKLVLTESNVADYRLTIEPATGHIGIGKQDPTASLDVAGSGKFSGSITVEGSGSTIPNAPPTQVTFYSNNFQNEGAPFENVTYYKDAEGRVHLSGVVKIIGSQNGSMFTLPIGYRPAGDILFGMMTSSNTVTRVNVTNNGAVTLSNATSGWVSVNGISFRAN